MIAAKETWGKHPDELAGEPYTESMLMDYMALTMLESEDIERISNDR